MNMKAAAVVVGVGFGVAAPFLKKRLKPMGIYVFARSVIAYEAACEVVDFTSDTISRSVRRAGKRLMPRPAKEIADAVSDTDSC